MTLEIEEDNLHKQKYEKKNIKFYSNDDILTVRIFKEHEYVFGTSRNWLSREIFALNSLSGQTGVFGTIKKIERVGGMF